MKDTGRNSGFTLFELLATFAILALASSLALPGLLNFIHRSKLEGAARQAVSMMQISRLEAIKRGVPAVVIVDPVQGELVAFADVDGASTTDPPDGIFNPVSGEPLRLTDYELGRFRLPNGIALGDPDGNEGIAAVAGFMNAAPLPQKRAVFRMDGSAEDDGAFRFRDLRGNFLEARLVAPTTARLEVRKWDGSDWRAAGEEGAWVWQ